MKIYLIYETSGFKDDETLPINPIAFSNEQDAVKYCNERNKYDSINYFYTQYMEVELRG